MGVSQEQFVYRISPKATDFQGQKPSLYKIKKIYYHMNFLPEKLDGRKLRLFEDAHELHRLYYLNLVDEALLIHLIKASSNRFN